MEIHPAADLQRAYGEVGGLSLCRAGIELTAGRDAKGYRRLSAERRAKVEEARRTNPHATQEEIARAAGVSRATVSRIERGDRRGASRFLAPRA
jgi:transcriptional regulator with XRE-family HTH domain